MKLTSTSHSKVSRVVALVAICLVGLSVAAAATPSRADAATNPVWLGWGAGSEGPAKIYYADIVCQGGHLNPYHSGIINVDAGLSAPSNIHYNWAIELQHYSNGWKHLAWSPTRGGSGSNIDLGYQWTVNGITQPTAFRAFFYIQNPLTAQWYYIGASGNNGDGTYCIM